MLLDSTFILPRKSFLFFLLRDIAFCKTLQRHTFVLIHDRWLLHKYGDMFFCRELGHHGIKVDVAKHPQTFYHAYMRKHLGIAERIHIAVFRE